MGRYEVKDVRPYIIRIKDTKEELDRARDLSQARDKIYDIEEQDKELGIFVHRTYEIVQENTKKIYRTFDSNDDDSIYKQLKTIKDLAEKIQRGIPLNQYDFNAELVEIKEAVLELQDFLEIGEKDYD